MPFVPTRMDNCTIMAAGRKIEYSWPLLDVRLVKLFLSIPSEENFYRGMGRYLHRRAIDGVVPQMVAWKQGKYMGPRNPDGLPDVAGELIALSELHPAVKDYVDMKKLEQQCKKWPSLQNKEMTDGRKFQLTRNIHAVKQIDA